jgi:Mce-associated membrane protein
VAALAVFAYAWVSWQQADGDPERARAVLRDDALIQGIAAVETMNSMDHREVDAGLDAWRSVTTGVLHDQLVAIGDDERQLLVDQGKIATGRVVEAAITELSDRTATMVAAMEVSVADGEGEEPTVKRNRFSADLVLVDSEWKLEELNQVAVSLS